MQKLILGLLIFIAILMWHIDHCLGIVIKKHLYVVTQGPTDPQEERKAIEHARRHYR